MQRQLLLIELGRNLQNLPPPLLLTPLLNDGCPFFFAHLAQFHTRLRRQLLQRNAKVTTLLTHPPVEDIPTLTRRELMPRPRLGKNLQRIMLFRRESMTPPRYRQRLPDQILDLDFLLDLFDRTAKSTRHKINSVL